ncbi:jg22712 [Pararge aegeria aegeria]|uniref:Jg22712 protein n=1 Tax=Pararge aegeria aegeria TaxID=348720 RepID=A0A8S4QZ15_9NEOP|nr:jg22712 [Pararge aegeria aegeria]
MINIITTATDCRPLLYVGSSKIHDVGRLLPAFFGFRSGLRVTQQLCLRDEIRNEEIRRGTRVTDIAHRVSKLNWYFCGKQKTDGRWGLQVHEAGIVTSMIYLL